MSSSQYNSDFNQPVYGAVVGEHNTVTINVSQPPPSPPPFDFASLKGTLPPTDPRTIQQRTFLVEDIYTELNKPDLNALVLTGIGGVGKSTLAAMVYRYTEAHEDTVPFTAPPLWLTIGPSDTIADLVGTIYQELGEPVSKLANLSLANIAKALFNTLAMTKATRLIVLDQFENFLDWNTGAALPDHLEVGTWLDALNSQPFHTGCRLLLTSRPHPKGRHVDLPLHLLEYPVDGLTITEGTEFLRKQGVRATEVELHKAVSDYNGHALSLTLIVTLGQVYQMPLSALLSDPARLGDDIATHLLDAIFMLLNDTQRDLLRAFSVYDIPVPFETISSKLNPEEQTKAFQAMRPMLIQHLIQPVEEGRYQLHIIVANYFKQHFVEGDVQANQRAVQVAEAGAIRYRQEDRDRRTMLAKEDRDRRWMLAKVRSFWIREILEESLHGAAPITPGLGMQRDAVANSSVTGSRRLILQQENQSSSSLPAGTHITQVFDKVNGELLILGEPGSGKTTLLLELARDLLDRAQKNTKRPIPVVFNLSSWAGKRRPLIQWLVEELNVKYQIPLKVGQAWVDADQLLLLLDGLDEVAAEHREACIDAINEYRLNHSQVPMVVCSRITEYEQTGLGLRLQSAVVVQPLTREQIEEYLISGGEQLAGVRKAFDEDKELQELATTPLMLSTITLAYAGISAKQLSVTGSLAARREQVLATYVERMLSIRRPGPQYTQAQSSHWLMWLARQLVKQNQTEFYLERMQLDRWLEKSRPVEIYISLAFALLSFPIAAIVYGLEYSMYGLKSALVNGTLAGLTTALIAFFFVWFIEADIRLGRLFPKVSGGLEESKNRSKLATFFSQFHVERVAFALLSGLLQGIVVEFLVGPFYSLINGVFIAAFLVVLGRFEREIRPAETLVWSWKSVWKHALESFLQGFAIGVLGGVFNALPYLQQLNVFLATLCFWLSLGVTLGIIIMLMRGFSTDKQLDPNQRIKPNQGIRNSLSNSLKLGLSSGTLLGLVVFFFYSYVIHNVFVVGYVNELPTNVSVIYGVSGAVALAYLFWLINGGFACVQHLVLRVLLWTTGCTPWRYPRFLDYAHERILLRKIGGGYTFIHRLLRDYFANLGIEESFSPTPAESHQSEEPLILPPVLSDATRLLPCGHEQRDPHARFCSVCGAPISL